MYFSGLRKAIESLEEKKFYDIALLYLTAQGYKDVHIIDGAGDGGRDVSTSHKHLRIQLSVRKDWANKINSEAALALKQDRRHLLYITNRSISESDSAEFRANDYKCAGEVELSIIDLKALASSLALPGVVQSTYEILGFKAGNKVAATAHDVALSSYLLFSKGARELRQEIYECNIKACVYKAGALNDDEIVEALRSALPGVNVEAEIQRICVSLRSRGVLGVSENRNVLSPSVQGEMRAAELDYLSSIENDLALLRSSYGLNDVDAKALIEIALELVARGERVDGSDLYAVRLLDFISNKGLARKKEKLFEDLSALSQARIKAYGSAVNHIFATNTFDIYRALGKNSEIVMLLDSSVAMPMIFGLTFGAARSRYGLAAASLHELCVAHGIAIRVPRCYLNEMASHGLKALDYIDEYDSLDGDIKDFLRESGNAYLSHFSHIRKRGEISADYDLKRFLRHFGVTSGASVGRVENSIETILSASGIEVFEEGRWEPNIRQAVADLKPYEFSILVDHDARVATYLRENTDKGFIFATWDKALIEIVEGLSRILADNPAKVMDFLSMATGSDYESRQSVSLLTTLLYIDDQKSADMAKQVEKIKKADRLHELNEMVAELRSSQGNDFSIEDAISSFFDTLEEKQPAHDGEVPTARPEGV